ncbi:MAG: HIT family protein [Oscillospiraceae bacterium]
MCFICDRINMIKDGTNPYFVKELETGYVVLGDNQHFKGYSIFICKEHKTELFHLDHSYMMKFLEEMSIVAEAVSKAFSAEKMYSDKNRPSNAELEEMKSKLLEELEKLL